MLYSDSLWVGQSGIRSLQDVQTGSGSPASYPMGVGVLSYEQSDKGMKLTTSSHLVLWLRMKQIELNFFKLNRLYVTSKLECSPDACLIVWYFQWQ